MTGSARRWKMSPRTCAQLVLLALLLPVWGFGVVRGGRISEAIGLMPPFFAGDSARFALLRPRLQGTDTAYLLLDRAPHEAAGERLFVAQYALAPCVLSLARKVVEVAGDGWSGERRLVILAFDDSGRLAGALRRLEASAQRRGIAFRSEAFDDRLVLVTLGGG